MQRAEFIFLMIPLIVLAVSFFLLRCTGFLGAEALDNWNLPLRIALFLMFMLTASAHWGKGRPDLIRMLPPSLPNAAGLVTITGILEIAGAIGLLPPSTARLAAICLALLLLALFPANMRAARERLTIMGRPAPGLVIRGMIQLIFLMALAGVAAQNP
jgi:uncharacterized membrane protein